jgi:hypothetical protein
MASTCSLKSSLKKLDLPPPINQGIARKERRRRELVENQRKINKMNHLWWDNYKESLRMTMVRSGVTSNLIWLMLITLAITGSLMLINSSRLILNKTSKMIREESLLCSLLSILGSEGPGSNSINHSLTIIILSKLRIYLVVKKWKKKKK